MAYLTCQKCGSGPFGESASYCFACGQPLENGGLLHNKYRLVRMIGEGGLGFVYLAEDVGFYNRRCALKRIGPPKTDLDPEYAQREVEILVNLNNRGLPGIPEIYESFIINRSFFVAMKLIEGQNLLDWVVQSNPTWNVIVEQMVQVSRILANLHSLTMPVIHADIKPENILLDEFKQQWLVDFGFARPNPGMSRTSSSYLPAGSVKFTPWEQWQKRPTTAADVYAVAMTLYYLLVGEEVFNQRANANAELLIAHPGLVASDYFDPAWPPLLREALLKATVEVPDKRISSKVLMEMLSAAVSGTPLPEPAPAPAVVVQPEPAPPVVAAPEPTAGPEKAAEPESQLPPTAPAIFTPRVPVEEQPSPEIKGGADVPTKERQPSLPLTAIAPPQPETKPEPVAAPPEPGAPATVIISLPLSGLEMAALAGAGQPPAESKLEGPQATTYLPVSPGIPDAVSSSGVGAVKGPPPTVPRPHLQAELAVKREKPADTLGGQIQASQAGRSFQLRDGRKLYRPRDLADLAERNGEYAVEMLKSGQYVQWLRSELIQGDLATRVDHILSSASDGIDALESVLALLLPEAPTPRLMYQPSELDLGLITKQPKKFSLYIGKSGWGFLGARVVPQANWIEVEPSRLAISGQGYHRLAVIVHPERLPVLKSVISTEILLEGKIQHCKIKVSGRVEIGKQLGRFLSRPFSK